VGDGLDRVMETGAALSAVAEDLVVLHAGEGVLDASPDPSVLGVAFFLAGQQGSSGAFAVRDEEPGVDVGGVGQHGDALASVGKAGVPPCLRIGGVARNGPAAAITSLVSASMMTCTFAENR
jgi:hypothetical protein